MRLAAFSALLADAVARHGWSERFEVVCAGIGPGAGEVDRGRLAAAGLTGVEDLTPACPDVGKDAVWIEESEVLVVGTEEEAREFLAWPEAEGKRLFALSDYLGDDGWALVDAGASLEDYVGQVREGVPLLLRAMIAEPA